MTLREQIAADVGDVLLNTDDFGEICTYLPQVGDLRSIVCVVEEDSQQVDERNTLVLAASIRVFVSRDSSDGIDAPQLGDKLCRESDHLADDSADPGKCYSFAGVVDESDDATGTAWTLAFVRNQPDEIGGHRR